MNSIILRTAASFLLPLLLLASIVILLRGHNEPGGGFVGGLTAAAGFLLHLQAVGPERCRSLLPPAPETIPASGLPAVLGGDPVFTARWSTFEPVPGVKLGTPLLFDIGVHLAVSGSVLLMILSIADWPAARRDADGSARDSGGAA